eukprot:TRINITY_DN3582_c0_g1_i6.p1 TRINITY_DN3582_c0_g1~~TRINITY_DN3582_c0_g1_i6.p1  ORF type:complete len:752 (-),score=224.72 TRINITY_DN3582_c0_g1_i6:89-2344(-)
MKRDDCSVHCGKRLEMFCEEFGCWKRVCARCVQEFHQGHRVIAYSELTNEAKSQKEKLIRAKKGDVMSLKKILEALDSLQIQLGTAQRRKKIEAKQAEINIAARIQKAVKDGESRFMELYEELLKVKTTLKECFDMQSQEVMRIPELADAVIAQGTLEDLQTFFEMCQNGVESNIEIVNYKKNVDWLRKNVEDFITINPLNLLFGFDKSIYEAADLTQVQIPETTVKIPLPCELPKNSTADKDPPRIQSAIGFTNKGHMRTNSTSIETTKATVKGGGRYLQKTTRNNRSSLDNTTTLVANANAQVGNAQKYRTIFNKTPAVPANKEKVGSKGAKVMHKKNPSDLAYGKKEFMKTGKVLSSNKKDNIKERKKMNTSIPSSTRNSKRSSICSSLETSQRKGTGLNLKAMKSSINSLRVQFELLSKAMKANLNTTLAIPSTINSILQHMVKQNNIPLAKFMQTLKSSMPSAIKSKAHSFEKLASFMRTIESIQAGIKEMAQNSLSKESRKHRLEVSADERFRLYSEESSIQEHKVENVSILEDEFKEYSRDNECSMNSFGAEIVSVQERRTEYPSLCAKLRSLGEKAGSIKERLNSVKTAARDSLFSELKQNVFNSLKDIVKRCELIRKVNKNTDELDTTKETSGELKMLVNIRDKENQEEPQQAAKQELLQEAMIELDRRKAELEKKDKETAHKILVAEEQWRQKLEEIQMENKDLIEEYDKCQSKYSVCVMYRLELLQYQYDELKRKYECML